LNLTPEIAQETLSEKYRASHIDIARWQNVDSANVAVQQWHINRLPLVPLHLGAQIPVTYEETAYTQTYETNAVVPPKQGHFAIFFTSVPAGNPMNDFHPIPGIWLLEPPIPTFVMQTPNIFDCFSFRSTIHVQLV